MKITFLGAAHEVTGSCTLLQTNGKNILIDCGMEQGPDMFKNQELPVSPLDVDCVILTHAHIDHSGNLPLLYKNGFRGTVYATGATTNLCKIMLLDSAHIQEFEAQWRNRKAIRAGKQEYVPVYNIEDALKVAELFKPVDYKQKIRISSNVEVRFNDMGHMLGSSCIEIWITEKDATKKIVFSGDVGNLNQPILKNPQRVAQADYVVIESTYGNRYHQAKPDYIKTLADYIQKTFDRGGNVVIPSFAIGRTQEILYFIREIIADKLVKGHDGFSVYVDSPLANEATDIFMKCDEQYFDEETIELMRNNINPLTFPGLKISVSSEESKAINFDSKPKIIISSSGMCEAGRIKHHLKHNLWRKDSLILFVGYQAVGTLGRILYDGAKNVKLFGEDIAVNAEIGLLPGISGHADKTGLVKWLSGFSPNPEKVFVNHGEDKSCTEFTEHLKQIGYNAVAPYSGAEFDLADGKELNNAVGIPADKKTKFKNTVFERLIAAAERLLAAARKCDGMPNKELSEYADRIDNITDKMMR